jgi:hypothetical protein
VSNNKSRGPGITEPDPTKNEKLSERFDVGVLVVHGIGEQERGETLNQYVDAIYSWIRDRLAGVAAGHRMRGTTRETLEKLIQLTPERLNAIACDPSAPARHVALQCIAYLENSSSFRPTAKPGMEDAPQLLLDGEPLLGSVTLSYDDVTGENNSDTTTLHLQWTDSNGNNHAARWLIAEAWWSKAFLAPSLLELLRWAPLAIPLACLSRWWSIPQTYRRAGKIRNLLQSARSAALSVFWTGAAIFAAPLLYLILVAAEALSWIPWTRLQSAAQAVKTALAGFVGDAFMLAAHPSSRAAMLRRIERDLGRLAGRCKSVLVVGHSQGAMLAYLACRTRPANVRTLLTLGSGIRTLRALLDAAERKDVLLNYSLRSLAIAQMAGVGMLAAAAAGLAQAMHPQTAFVLGLVFAVLATASGLLGYSSLFTRSGVIPADDAFWHARMQAEGFKWRDLMATHDPVAGPLQTPIQIAEIGAVQVAPDIPRAMPRAQRITNAGSVLTDHTSYLANREECVATLVWEAAKLDGTGSHQWLAPDPARIGIELIDNPFASPISHARNHIVRRGRFLSLGLALITLAIVWIRFHPLLPFRSFSSVTSVSEALKNAWSAIEVSDLGIAIVVISAWISVRTARSYSADRLTTAVLERRNHEPVLQPDGTVRWEDRSFRRYSSMSPGEWIVLAVSGLLPMLLFLALYRYVEGWALALSVLIAALAAHFVASGSLLVCDRREREIPYRGIRARSRTEATV